MIRFFTRCEGCKRFKFWITRRAVFLPKMGITAQSQLLICGSCARGVQKALNAEKPQGLEEAIKNVFDT